MAERGRRVLAAMIVALGLVAGCAEIPTSGPVVPGEAVRQPLPNPYVRVDVPGPQAGDDQVGIVTGFLQAMTSYKPGYPEAREFLTDGAGSTWDPTAGITVHVGATPTVEQIDETQVRVSFTVSGRVGTDGAYAAAEPDDTQEFVLRMQRDGDDWRIDDPPEGVVMSEFHFIREFEPYNLYFFDPTYSVLVPDPVYVPRNGRPATLLAQALLRGPSDWLAPAVRTAFPESTELSVRSVPVEGGAARIELTDQPSRASVQQREHMAAQLAWTLSGITEVSGVDVTSGGLPLFGDATLPPDAEFGQYDPTVLPRDVGLFTVVDDGIAELVDNAPVPVAGPLGSMADAREVAVNTGGNRAAVIDDSRTQLRVATFGDEQTVETIATGTELASPAWDRTGLIWAVDRAPGQSRLLAFRPDGEEVSVGAPGLEGRDVERLAISLDGTRVALVVDGQAYVGLVVRDAGSGRGIEISGLRRIGPEAESLDVSWIEPASLGLLLRPPGEEPEPYVVGLSGAVSAQRGSVPDAVSLTGAPGQRLIVATSEGALLTQDPTGQWIDAGVGRWPAYPG